MELYKKIFEFFFCIFGPAQVHYDGKIINFTTLGFLIFKKLQNVELFMDDTPIEDTRQRTTDGDQLQQVTQKLRKYL